MKILKFSLMLIFTSSFMGSCCSICTESVNVVPTVETSGEGDAAKKTTGISATITFSQCRDRAVCLAMNELNKQMRQYTKMLIAGKLTFAEYVTLRDAYSKEVHDLAKLGTVSGDLPKKPEEGSGRSALGGIEVSRDDFQSSRAFDIAVAAKLVNAADTMKAAVPSE